MTSRLCPSRLGRRKTPSLQELQLLAEIKLVRDAIDEYRGYMDILQLSNQTKSPSQVSLLASGLESLASA
jgi:hypothetical protein